MGEGKANVGEASTVKAERWKSEKVLSCSGKNQTGQRAKRSGDGRGLAREYWDSSKERNGPAAHNDMERKGKGQAKLDSRAEGRVVFSSGV